MATTRFRLQTQHATEDFFRDARLVGIVSRMKEYQLCWQLNRELSFGFRMNNELEVVLMKKGKKCYFPVYEYEEPTRFTTHYLYNNHYRAEFLLPELKHIDFIWLLKGDFYSAEELQWLMDGIRALRDVQLVVPVRPGELKNRENLIF